MDRYFPHWFAINALLVLCDAALGFHIAPLLSRFGKGDPDSQPLAASAIRRLLALMVAIYMFFNCLAYFRGNSTLLVLVTIVVILDILFQLVLQWKVKRGGLQ
jgi:ABC-type siderophore export system fused ATPase/permease subunit